jgi:peptidoglycan hydrolase-like protein with peptidoglycan-binding domain
MLIVNQGAEGPRAVALQILLNRFKAAGTPLEVDGHYGPKTAKAVEGFRREVLKVPGPGGSTDLAFWKDLLWRSRLQTIEAVDVTDPMLYEMTIPELEKQKATTIALAGTSNGVAQVMSLVSEYARSIESVLLLRFHAHGGPGVLSVSNGTRRLSAGVDAHLELNILDKVTVEKLRPTLGMIRDVFANFGFVEFHACRIAEGPQGQQLLQTLANIWNVPVTAPVGKQNAADNVFFLKGTTRTFYPGGVSLRQWAQTRNSEMLPFTPQGAMCSAMVSQAY